MRRFPLAARLTIILTGVAVLTLASSAFVQDRALSRGLHAAAADRLDRSARATERLLIDHLRELVVRYVAVSRTPELRAHLELGHGPTLERLARSLVRQSRATRLVFADADWKMRAQFSVEKRGGSLLATWQAMRTGTPPIAACVGPGDSEATFAPCVFGRDLRPQATIQRLDGEAQVLVLIPLSTGARRVGIMLISEPLGSSVLDGWSELVGARVAAVDPRVASDDPLVKVAHAFPHLELRVSSSLLPELATLAGMRRHEALAGVVALAIALGISALSARDFLRPIRKIRWATEQVGRGDLDVRLRSTRTDEIGDVARVLDDTLDRLRSSQQRLRNVQRIAHFGDWSADLARDVIEGSPEFANVLGLAAEGGKTLGAFLRCFASGDREKLDERMTRCSQDGTPIELDLRTAGRAGGRILHVRARRVADGGGAARIEGSVQDVTDRRRAEEQIRFLAFHDSLTGLPNRRFLSERLALALTPMQRKGFSLLFLDLDRFKLVNDTLGHSAGDELLCQVAERLTRIVGQDSGTAVARFGGDEFALLLPGLIDEPPLVEVVSDLLRAVALPVELQGHEMAITASVGIARWPADGQTIEAVLRSCDTALHRAKENGRNCFCLYDSTMEEEANQRWTLENRLRRAVEAMAFEVYYQPRVSAVDGALVGFEALLRWRDLESGGYKPAEFIPIAGRPDSSSRWGAGCCARSSIRSAAGWMRGCRSDACPSMSRADSSRAISWTWSAARWTARAWIPRCSRSKSQRAQ